MAALTSICFTICTCCCILQVGMLLGDLMESIEQRALTYAQKEETGTGSKIEQGK